MNSVLEKVACIFDALAKEAVSQKQGGEKTASVKVDGALVSKLSSAYEVATQQPLDAEIAVKIASDPDLTKAVQRLMSAQEPPAPLGDALDKTSEDFGSTSKQDRARIAADTFAHNILSKALSE